MKCIICGRNVRTGYRASIGRITVTCCRSHDGLMKFEKRTSFNRE